MLILALSAASVFAHQGVQINIGTGRGDTTAPRVASDSVYRARAARDSARAARRRERAVVATPEHLRTAFSSAYAQELLERARAARLSQDSALTGYDATAYQRATVGLALTRFGRERILLRYERAARVQWQRDRGARVEVLGERTVAPMFARGGHVHVDLSSVPPIPYFPGREPLLGAALARAQVSDRDIANPLASGAEAYYTYALGDSAAFRLPGGQTITLRELKVRPRTAKWSVLVASLWFDTANGRLVRAVYRMAEQMDIRAVARDEDGEDACDAPKVICAAMSPMTVDVPVVTIEYGLHEGRFWLPRVQMLEGIVRVGIMRVPFKLEQRYRYRNVNGTEPIAAVVVARADTASDSLSRAARARGRRARCPAGEYREQTLSRFDRTLNVAVRVPCDTVALASSPELPKSALSDNEDVFGWADREELIAQALTLGAQAGFSPQRPVITAGLSLTRYNRVEGLSSGIAVHQTLGGGYRIGASARIGTGDWEPNGDLWLERSNGRTTYTVRGYRRLAASNDWGDPLGFGSSVSALLFGRDEGFYYRTAGAELSRTLGGVEGNAIVRLFAEHQSEARVETDVSFANAISGKKFRDNITAERSTVAGLGVRGVLSRGLDPHGFRLLADARAEAAAGTFDYSRAALDLTLSRGLGPLLDAAITGAAGTSGGSVPVQRWWFLGGAQTVRGQPAGALAGDAFWLGRAEVGSSFVLARPTVFADFGWAGSRHAFEQQGTPVSGAGVGVSFLDGLIRVDVAKGIRPGLGVRGYFYLEARF